MSYDSPVPSQVQIDKILWDPSIYPRAKWSTATIERYADAMMAGEVFPPMVVERDTFRLLDGKHRIEAYKKAGVAEAPIRVVTVPEGMTPKYYAATPSGIGAYGARRPEGICWKGKLHDAGFVDICQPR